MLNAMLVVSIASCILMVSCSDSGHAKSEPTPDQSEAPGGLESVEHELQAAAARRKSAPAPSAPKIDYEVLRRWKPDNAARGLGMELLLRSDLDKSELVRFLRDLCKGKDPVMVRVYTSRKVWENERRDVYGDEYGKHFILLYVKNGTGRGAYRGCNEIRWMQETGRFSSLFGTKQRM